MVISLGTCPNVFPKFNLLSPIRIQRRSRVDDFPVFFISKLIFVYEKYPKARDQMVLGALVFVLSHSPWKQKLFNKPVN